MLTQFLTVQGVSDLMRESAQQPVHLAPVLELFIELGLQESQIHLLLLQPLEVCDVIHYANLRVQSSAAYMRRQHFSTLVRFHAQAPWHRRESTAINCVLLLLLRELTRYVPPSVCS